MANFLEDLLKDYDAEFGIGSNFDQPSSSSNTRDFARPTGNSYLQNSLSQQQSILNETQPKVPSSSSFKYQTNNTDKPQSFPPTNTDRFIQSNPNLKPDITPNISNNIGSESTFHEDDQQPSFQALPNPSPASIKINKISVEEATQIINDLKKERIKDARKMQQLQTENARLVAKITILEHTDLKVAELGSRVEQLLQKYLETEQIRAQQAAQISQLRQEVIVLKSQLGQNVGQNQRVPNTSTSDISNY